MTVTEVAQHVRAPAAAVYRALLDPVAVAIWMVPDGMTSEVHAFDARVGGVFRISLTYDDPGSAGKTGGATDTFEGQFVELVPARRVVQSVAFETDDSNVAGEMRISFDLRGSDGGTEVVGRHENLPPGVSAQDNELGWRMSLGKLAALVEGGNG